MGLVSDESQLLNPTFSSYLFFRLNGSEGEVIVVCRSPSHLASLAQYLDVSESLLSLMSACHGMYHQCYDEAVFHASLSGELTCKS